MTQLPGHWCSRLQDVQTTLHIGIHPHEHGQAQPLRVNVAMYVPFERLGPFRTVADVIDYDPVRDFIGEWHFLPHVDLLETMLEELVGRCFADERVEYVFASVMKTGIFAEAAGAGVEVFVKRDQWSGRHA